MSDYLIQKHSIILRNQVVLLSFNNPKLKPFEIFTSSPKHNTLMPMNHMREHF